MSLIVDIEKSYQGFHLQVAFRTDDKCSGILGASGSGKSMTLKCIAGIVTPDRGYIELNGRILYDSEKGINLPPQERNVGYLFQNYALFPHMTVRKNLEMAMTRVDRKMRNERIDSLIESFHLNDLAERYPRQLSGGQQQRAALARIMASKPEILLLDEPFSALDVYLRDQIQTEVRRVLRTYEGNSILVSHDINEAKRFCEKVVVLENGVCAEVGTVPEVFHHPQTVQTARLTGVRNLAVLQQDDRGICAFGCQLPVDETNTNYDYLGISEWDLIPEVSSETIDSELRKEGFRIPVRFTDMIESERERQLQFAVLGKDGSETGRMIWYRSMGEGETITENIKQIASFFVPMETCMWLKDGKK